MAILAQEVLAVWRDAERILEEYETREERDLGAETEIRTQIVHLRAAFQAITSTGRDADQAIASSRSTIASARRLLASMTSTREPTRPRGDRGWKT